MAKKKRKTYPKMSIEEKNAWFELDKYIRRNVMGYDENQGLSQRMVFRLKGLRWGQYLSNSNADKYANYTFEVILNTYKLCLPKIKKAFEYKRFDNDECKFNYALAIVNSNIAEVYRMMEDAKKAKLTAQVHADNIEQPVNSEYKPTNDNKKKQKKFDSIW